MLSCRLAVHRASSLSAALSARAATRRWLCSRKTCKTRPRRLSGCAPREKAPAPLQLISFSNDLSWSPSGDVRRSWARLRARYALLARWAEVLRRPLGSLVVRVAEEPAFPASCSKPNTLGDLTRAVRRAKVHERSPNDGLRVERESGGVPRTAGAPVAAAAGAPAESLRRVAAHLQRDER